MEFKKYAVIVAGGSGTRMGSSTPKQFMLLEGKPVLYYSIQAFLDAFEDMHIILVLPEDYIGAGQEIVDAYFDYGKITLCMGGRTRFHSVQNGLKHVEGESLVFVHDAVRCLCTPQLIKNCALKASEYGSAIPVVDCKDSVRILKGGENEPLNRNRIKFVQTPQVFHSKILLPAFAGIDYKEHFTDEATVIEAFGLKVHLAPGEESNIKLTYPYDFLFAKSILAEREKEKPHSGAL